MPESTILPIRSRPTFSESAFSTFSILADELPCPPEPPAHDPEKPTTDPSRNINILPDEILMQIFDCLNGSEFRNTDLAIFNAMRTCARWRFVAYEVLFNLNREVDLRLASEIFLQRRMEGLEAACRKAQRRTIDALARARLVGATEPGEDEGTASDVTSDGEQETQRLWDRAMHQSKDDFLKITKELLAMEGVEHLLADNMVRMEIRDWPYFEKMFDTRVLERRK